jgi:transcriptional regulator of acetoin/glycerol metabolism
VEACAAGISEPCCDDPSAAVQPAPMFEPSQQTAAGVSNWQEAERKLILDAMIKVRGKRDEAARLLGMGRSTLWRKMKKYGIA